MDRIFDKGSIEQICEDIKRILNESKDYMEQINRVAAQAEEAASGVPSGARDSGVSSAAADLKGKISAVELDTVIAKLDNCKTRACALIPAADAQYASQTDQLASTAGQVKAAVSQIRDFLAHTALGAEDFHVKFAAVTARCQSILDDAGEALDTLLKNVKGADDVSMIFSKDPVNLSTGNFIYDRTDLEVAGQMPFSFKRFYNAINDREGGLGKDWIHNYELFLEDTEDGKNLILEDGKEERFIRSATGAYAPFYHSRGTLTQTEEGHSYQTLDMTRYYFGADGKYLRKEDRNGNTVRLSYEMVEGLEKLVKAEKDTGEYFLFTYKDGKLDAVQDHTGRTVRYEVTDGLLKMVQMPDGGEFRYGYTPEGKLESVSSPREIVTVENTYDEKQRTVLQKFPDGGSMSYVYDDEKRTVELTERNGSRVVYVHDEQFRDVKHICSDGEEIFEYNQKNQKTKITDKLGNVTHMAYDSRGNLTSVINPLGTKLSVTYEAHNQPVSVSVDGKQKVKNRFDGRGNLLETIDALQRKTAFAYNGKGLPECIMQADGSRIHLSYDERGNIRELTDTRGGVTRYGYDKLNRVTESIDPNGNQTNYAYDKAGNLQTVTNADGCVRTYEYNESNKVTKITDFDGSIIQRVYNVLNKPEKIIDQLGRETKLTYDAMWNLARITEPNGARTTYFYNENNHLGRVKDANGNVRRYTYDGNGNRLSETDENGAVTRFAYDALGQLTHVEGPDGLAYTYTYDKEGHVTEVTDALDGRVRLDYDEAGQLIQETNQLGDSRSYTYTLLGNIESVTDEAGRVTRYVYLPGGQLQSVIHSDGTTESYTYDGNGNVKSYTNASGFTLSYFYDRLDRIIRIEGSEGERKEYTYDAVGNVTSMTDALGNCTRYEYSLTGQLTKVIDPLGNETEYSYDVCDRLTEIRQYGEDGSLKEGVDTFGMDEEFLEAERKNQRNRICHVTKYQRNLLGQVEAVTDALGLKEEYHYDPKGQLVEKLDKEGYLTKYGYTGQGDVNHIQYADGREVKYSYNPLRHLQEMEDWLGITKIATDPLGRAQNVQYPDGRAVSYTYGKAGERTSITYPDGKTVSYDFDKQVRLSELRDGDSVITYGYDAAGRLAEKNFPNGMHTDYQYDSKGQIQELIHTDREGILDRYTYQYDLLGNKTGIEKQRRGLEEESGSYRYGYDALGRLNGVTKNGNPLRAYQYDAFGNRTRLTEQGKTTTYAYNNVNQLLSRVDAEVEETYTYDKRGNLSQITANGQIKNQYLYGALNRLEQAVNGNGEAARYQYNGLGHRVGKVIGKDDFQTINEQMDPVKRLRSQTISPEKQIQYTIDLTREYHNLLQKEEDNHIQTFLWDGNVTGMLDNTRDTQQYYLQDELGSPIRLTDNGGNLSDSYGYDEFGQNLYNNQETMHPFGYTGYQHDDIAGTYFAQAREYLSCSAIFLGQDKFAGLVEWPITLNLYTYCIQSPLKRTDCTGFWFGIDDAIAAGVGAILGAGSQLIADVTTGVITGDFKLSSVETYFGAAVGGAVGGVTTIYAGPVVGCAVGAGSATVIGEGLEKLTGTDVKRNGYERGWGEILTDTAINSTIGAGAGALGKAFGLDKLAQKVKIPGITGGTHSWRGVYNQVLSRIINNNAINMSTKTLLKGLGARICDELLNSWFGALATGIGIGVNEGTGISDQLIEKIGKLLNDLDLNGACVS